LLNTSFNNNAEPIVDSVDDAVTAFLTTGLDYLVVGDCLVQRRDDWQARILDCAVHLPQYARLVESTGIDASGAYVTSYALANTYNAEAIALSARLFSVLRQQRADRSLRELLTSANGELTTLQDEVWELWGRRMILVRPVTRAAAATSDTTTARTTAMAERSAAMTAS
jgi:carbamoyltransferase